MGHLLAAWQDRRSPHSQSVSARRLAKVAAGLGLYAVFARFFAAPLAGVVAGYAYAFGAPANYQSGLGGHLDVAITSAILDKFDGRVLLTSRVRPTWIKQRRVIYGEVEEFDRTQLAMTRHEADAVLGPRSA